MKNRKEIIFIGGIISIIVVLFLISFFTKTEGQVAHVFVDNVEVKALPLDSDTTYSPPGLDEVVIKVSEGKVCIEKSNCKDQLCVEQGYISSTHEKIVCLPNKVVVTISGDESDLDGVLQL